jgi:diguanylate cyclase (GGDEF)-like protein
MENSTPRPGRPEDRLGARAFDRVSRWTAAWPYAAASALIVAEVIASVVPQRATSSVLVVRGALWLAIGLTLALVAHNLRQGIRRTEQERDELQRRATALGDAAQHLTLIRDPDQVVSAATRLAAELVAPPGTPCRAVYARVQAGMVTTAARYDLLGNRGPVDPFPLDQNPYLEQTVQTRQVVVAAIDPQRLGPALQPLAEKLELTHSAYMPIHFLGDVDGVLTVSFRASAVSPVVAEHCTAVAHMVELALDHARAHAALREQATTDPLTGLANRRGFERRVANRPGRGPFVILAIDLDDLKQVNDTMGHFAGDQLLIGTAQAINSVLRRGDVLARIGGDEFVIYSFLSELADGRHIAERILDALRTVEIGGFTAGVSIGVAAGRATDAVAAVYETADAAMYESKRGGGRRYTLVDSPAALTEGIA